MAAVLALVMLPVVASVGCLFGSFRHDVSPASAFAFATFFALAAGVLFGALRIARTAEGDQHHAAH